MSCISGSDQETCTQLHEEMERVWQSNLDQENRTIFTNPLSHPKFNELFVLIDISNLITSNRVIA